jgi:hypothetical protein
MSDNLKIPPVPTAITNRSALFNRSVEALDARLSEVLIVLVDESNAASLSEQQLRGYALFVVAPDSPAPNADIALTIPAGDFGKIAFQNNTAQNLIIVTEEV